MTSLESRKLLLLAESELNRAQLIQEYQMVTDVVHALVHRAGNLVALASAAATLVAGVASLRCAQPPPAADKPSWLKTILKGAGLISTLWAAVRPPPKD